MTVLKKAMIKLFTNGEPRSVEVLLVLEKLRNKKFIIKMIS